MAEWPRESVEQRSQRLLRALDETGICDWTPHQRSHLLDVVMDLEARRREQEQLSKRKSSAEKSLRSRIQIAMAIIAVMGACGSFLGSWLSSHSNSPIVVQAPAATPRPTPSPSPLAIPATP